ncbi:MAG: alpha-2-macroglobulin family protein [Brevirhabdus sp.]
MQRFVSVALAAIFVLSAPASAQDQFVPDRRAAVSRNLDFYGSDLGQIFDTNYTVCRNACLEDRRCKAFTFNTRSNSCFTKTEVTEIQPYEGAFSARILETAPGLAKRAETRAAELGFLKSGDFRAALNQTRTISSKHLVNEWTEAELLDAARQARAQGNVLSALRFTGAALNLSDAADQWVEFARLNTGIQTKDSKQRRDFRSAGLSASVNGYLRAENAALRASALFVMAQALEENRRGKAMIQALRLAQSIQPRDDAGELLDKAIAKYGFNVAETEVESDSAEPRICAVFNEPLVRNGVDYTPYVQLPEPGLSVDISGRKLCVSGVSHGTRYRVTLRAGLPAESGEALVKPVTLTQYVRDRSPAVRFPGRAFVLPRTEDAGIPVTTVNLTEVELKLRRVSDRNLVRSIQENFFGRPLSYYADQLFSRDVAEQVWTGTGTVQQELNRDMTTRLPMGDVVRDLPPGIYALSAGIVGADPYDDPPATQWFVITDLGTTTMTGADGLHVFVRSLATAEARAGVDVELVSNANEVLGTATTDARGYARFDAGLTRGTGAAAPAMVTVRDGADDLAFLSLRDPEFDLSDRGVEGHPPAPPIDVFLTTERGAYRAGEVVHATALVRDAQARALPGVPMTAVLTRPDGVEYTRVTSTDDLVGGHVFDFPLAGGVPRGTWTLEMHADPEAPALAQQQFLVEDFLPERIDFDLDLPDGLLALDRATDLRVTARYLFGAVGAELPVEGELRLTPSRQLEAFPGYRFGRYDAPFRSRTSGLVEMRTDAEGVALMPVDFPQIDAKGQPLKADFTVRVSEGSGRPVERRIARDVRPDGPMIGIRPMFDGDVPEGTEAQFQLIAVNQELAQMPMRVKVTVNRLRTRYQWYQLYGDWNWEPTTTRTKIISTEVTLDPAAPLTVSAPTEWGRYEIRVERLDGEHVASAEQFYAGWYAPADTSDSPDVLEMSLDAQVYRPGDVARLRVVPRGAGIAQVSVLSNRLIDMKAVAVTEGENLIDLPVTENWGTGAYVTVQLIRPMDAAAGRNPARALGLAHASIDPGPRQLAASFDMAAEVAPRGPLDVALRVDGVAEGETAFVTIAAVDVGILNLTGFAAPDPSDHYFGQRRLGMGIRDVYGRLIDGMNGAMGKVRAGGDAATGMTRQAPPPTEELVAYFSGPVTVGADGMARTSFDLPEFNGTVRLMAVVWSPTGVGEAETDILVRDPVVMTASVPRFMAPGDVSRLLLEITHAKGPGGRIGLDMVTEGGLSLDPRAVPSGLDLPEGGRAVLDVPLVAEQAGIHKVRIALVTAAGQRLTKTLMIPVQVNDPEIAVTSRFELAAGKSFLFDDNVFAAMVPGSGHAVLTAGPLGRFDAPGLLATLDRYPYGCTEQITSRALPLLYFDTVARAMGLGDRKKVDERISQAITAVLANQSSNGAFGLWRPGYGDGWLDAYVTDFLSRARAQGHAVPDHAFRMALDNLRNQVNYAQDFDAGGEEIAYALMVLAREGAAAVGDLRYYADVKGDAFRTSLSLAQMGAALASYGDPTRADAMFAKAARKLAGNMGDERSPLWRVDYGTNLRDAAAVLTLGVEAGTEVLDRTTLARRVATGSDRPRSTQEALWSLMAANAMIEAGAGRNLSVDGVPSEGALVRVLEADAAKGLDIRNTGDSAEMLTLTTFGVPAEPEPKGGNGYSIDRFYFTMEGEPVELEEVAQGTRLVVLVKVTPHDRYEARLMVSDPLPAGFEIDNPNLLRGGDIGALDWLDLKTRPRHAEFRQDRFLAAVDWRKADAFQLAYIVRAVSPGDYHHPAASVEDMYRPQFRARTDVGRVRVVAE